MRIVKWSLVYSLGPCRSCGAIVVQVLLSILSTFLVNVNGKGTTKSLHLNWSRCNLFTQKVLSKYRSMLAINANAEMTSETCNLSGFALQFEAYFQAVSISMTPVQYIQAY